MSFEQNNRWNIRNSSSCCERTQCGGNTQGHTGACLLLSKEIRSEQICGCGRGWCEHVSCAQHSPGVGADGSFPWDPASAVSFVLPGAASMPVFLGVGFGMLMVASAVGMAVAFGLTLVMDSDL